MAMEENVTERADLGKRLQRNRISPEPAPCGAQLGLLQRLPELQEHGTQWSGWMNNVVLSRDELRVFALKNLFWVSVLCFQEACALCKQRG